MKKNSVARCSDHNSLLSCCLFLYIYLYISIAELVIKKPSEGMVYFLLLIAPNDEYIFTSIEERYAILSLFARASHCSQCMMCMF